MASYTLTKRAVHDKVLVANTADTVALAESALAWDQVEILTDGTADLYVATDGSAATISGTKVPASAGASSVVVSVEADGSGSVLLSLISAGTPKYSVTRA